MLVETDAFKSITEISDRGKYLMAFLDRLINFDSSIIIANRKRIAIAPTYTTINNNARNSHSRRNSKNAEDKKLATKNNKENTGC